MNSLYISKTKKMQNGFNMLELGGLVLSVILDKLLHLSESSLVLQYLSNAYYVSDIMTSHFCNSCFTDEEIVLNNYLPSVT